MYKHKIEQLEEILNCEEKQPKEQQFGANLFHWSGKPVNIDVDGIRALVRYYKRKDQRIDQSK